jgi:hypothetical protein
VEVGQKWPTLQEKWQESNDINHENRNDTAFNPVKDGDQVVTPGLAAQDVPILILLADIQLLVERTNV